MGNVVESKFSIAKHLEEKENEEDEITVSAEEKLPEDDFSEELLRSEWARFLKELSAQNMVIYNAINPFKLTKTGKNEIEISYSSDFAKEQFEVVSRTFFTSFKRKVNNFKIELRYKEEKTLQKAEILSKRKIFEQMMEINPVLKDLEELMRFDYN